MLKILNFHINKTQDASMTLALATEFAALLLKKTGPRRLLKVEFGWRYPDSRHT